MAFPCQKKKMPPNQTGIAIKLESALLHASTDSEQESSGLFGRAAVAVREQEERRF